MVSSSQILAQIVQRILREMRPEKIILFGSRVRGNARPDSDYDLLVITRSRLPRYRRAGKLYASLASLPVDVEVMVYTPAEVRQWRDVPRAFVTTALREGKVIYEEKK